MIAWRMKFYAKYAKIKMLKEKIWKSIYQMLALKTLFNVSNARKDFKENI